MRQGGGYVAAGITYAPLFDREGRLVNLIANVRDITRFREAEEVKSTFISIISHELKTPVSLIKGYAETLRREDAEWDPATIQDSLAVIVEEADRLADLIENLLDASRLQAGALKLNRAEVLLDQLAARLVEKFKTQSEKHALSAEFPADFPPVMGDEDGCGRCSATCSRTRSNIRPAERSSCADGSSRSRWSSASATRGRASPPPTCRASSTAFTAPTPT
jgi:signal transduction histidine kinase